MINASRLEKLKPGALLVNVARGDIVDTNALAHALTTGQVAGAALDVCDPEPIPADHPILKLANVILTPHMASVSEKAVRTLREAVATLAAQALASGLPPNIVNGINAPRPWTPLPAPAQKA
jgi:phosphoglycerate dehydrogenase-like enzyme